MSKRRVAVVTGANKGIGLEIARQLAREGITVYIGARDEARGREAAEKLRGEGLDARPLRLDVTDEKSVAAAAAFAREGRGPPRHPREQRGHRDRRRPAEPRLDGRAAPHLRDERLRAGARDAGAAAAAAPLRGRPHREPLLGPRLAHAEQRPELALRVGEVPRVQQLEERGERDHRAARVGAARHEGQGERRRPGLRGDGHEPAPGRALGRAGRRDAGAARDAPGRRPDRRLLQRRRAPFPGRAPSGIHTSDIVDGCKS